MAQLIGLVGPATVGKSYVAERLQADHDFSRVSFSGGIKAAVRAIIESCGTSVPRDWIDRALTGDLKDTPFQPLGGLTSRQVQIRVGQALRAADPEFWVNQAENKIKSHLLNGQSVVIDDIRQYNEARVIRKYGGVIVQLATDVPLKYVADIDASGIKPHLVVINSRNTQVDGQVPVATKVLRAVQDWNEAHGVHRDGW